MMIKNMLKESAFRVGAAIWKDEGPKVLYYHDIYDRNKYYLHGTPLSLFKQHIYLLKKLGWSVVSSIPVKPKEAMLTFDDGFHGIWDCRDFLYENNLMPTVFISVDLVGKDNYLNWDEIMELQMHGVVFESHAWSHRRLTEVPRQELERELRDSRCLLSERLGRSINRLCFPQGRFNEEILSLSRQYGYTEFFSCIYGNADKHILPGLICRNLVQEVGTKVFKAILDGGANPFWRRYYAQQCVVSL